MLDRCLVLFTKPAVPGRVKTRLIGDLTADEAAALHAAFQADLLERLVRGRFVLRIAWALEPCEEIPDAPAPGFRQRGNDLGERLLHGLGEVAGEFPYVAAVGSDHPELPLTQVEAAFETLDRGTDVVLGPTPDGGYYLLGVRSARLDPGLFSDLPWSTGRLFDETLARCHRLGLTTAVLEEVADVDRPEDLAALRHRLLSVPRPPCRRTAGLLRSLAGGRG